MLRILPHGNGDVVGIQAVGRLSDSDYKTLLPELDAMLNERGRVSMVFDLRDFKGSDLHAMWDDLAYGLKHVGEFPRIAILGNTRWEGRLAGMAHRLMRAEVEHFPADQREAAWDWVRGAPIRH